GGARLPPGTGAVPAGGRDRAASSSSFWLVAILSAPSTVTHGRRVRRHIAASGATCRGPRADGPRPLCARDGAVLPGRVACGPPAPGGSPRTLHAGPALDASVPHGCRPGGGLPHVCCHSPLGARVPGASPLPRLRGPGVGP